MEFDKSKGPRETTLVYTQLEWRYTITYLDIKICGKYWAHMTNTLNYVMFKINSKLTEKFYMLSDYTQMAEASPTEGL